jgi:hypothetical protein
MSESQRRRLKRRFSILGTPLQLLVEPNSLMQAL